MPGRGFANAVELNQPKAPTHSLPVLFTAQSAAVRHREHVPTAMHRGWNTPGLSRHAYGAGRKRVKGGFAMYEKILALLVKIPDEATLEKIYWFIERLLVKQPPKH